MSRLCQKRGKVENNGEKETKGSEGVEKGLAEVEVVDSDVALVCGLWLCIALERKKGAHFSNHCYVFQKCPISGRRTVEKDEEKKEEVKEGLVQGRQR